MPTQTSRMEIVRRHRRISALRLSVQIVGTKQPLWQMVLTRLSKSLSIPSATGSPKSPPTAKAVFLTTIRRLRFMKLRSNMHSTIPSIPTRQSIYGPNQYPHRGVTASDPQILTASAGTRLLTSRWHWYQTLQDRNVMRT